MNLKNIYHHDLFRTIIVSFLAIFCLFFAVAMNDEYKQIYFVYYLYLIFAFTAFSLGYLEMASITVLGMGITRYSIFRKYHFTLLIMLVSLSIISIYYDVLIMLSEKDLERLNYGLLLFLNFVILFAGQVGLLFANLRFNKYFGAIFSGIIFIWMLNEINSYDSKLFINIMLGAISVLLIIVNYALIKNLNLQKYF